MAVPAPVMASTRVPFLGFGTLAPNQWVLIGGFIIAKMQFINYHLAHNDNW